MEAYSKVNETPEILNELTAAQQQAKNDAAASSRLADIEKRGGQLGMLSRTFRRVTGQNTSASDAADRASEARARQAGARSVGQYYSSTTGKEYKDYKTALKDPRVKAAATPRPQRSLYDAQGNNIFDGTPRRTPSDSPGPNNRPPAPGSSGTSGAKPVSTTVLAKKGGVEGKLDKATGKFTAGAFSAAEKSRYASVAAKNSATSATKSTSSQTGDKAKDMATWAKANPTLAKNVTPSGTQKGSGQSEMSKQAAELRDMQKASQMRQKGADVMGSNITSVRKDLETANKPENLNKPAPAGTALERQQKMTALKKPSPDLKMDLDIFDLVKGHLLDEGYAETEQNAIVMMANMSEEWRNSILDELYKGKHGQSEKEYQAGRSDAGKRISGDDKEGPASYASRWHKDSEPTKPGKKPKNTQKVSKDELDYARARHKSVSGKSWNKVGGPKGLPEEVEINEKAEKWIQKAIKKPGALSKQLGVPEEENIPMDKLKAAAKKGGTLGKRANLAMTLKGLKKEKK